MQIILVHNKFKQARTIALSGRHVAWFAAMGIVVTLFLAWALASWALSSVAKGEPGVIAKILPASVSSEVDTTAQPPARVRENLDAMAEKLGELQAKVTRLDAIGERVSNMVGVKAPSESTTDKQPAKGGPGRGGPLNSSLDALTIPDLQTTLQDVERSVEIQADTLSVLEAELMDRMARSRLFPSSAPIQAGHSGSGFGWRSDPFTGRRAMHEGVDFAAPRGTPIYAAAGGTVVAAEYHHEYGNYVDLSHGNGLTTRYAHASRLRVKVGQIVKARQQIADVGSTGRSTGPHLHFEVRMNGSPQNPSQFLLAGGRQGPGLRLSAR